MKNQTKLTAVLAAAALLTGSASAQSMLIDFDSATNPFSGGVISTNYAVSGTSSLFFDLSVQGAFDLPAQYQGQHVQISMQMLDLGKWLVPADGRVEGPRLGVAASPFAGANTSAVAIYNASFVGADDGYVTNQDAYAVTSGTWFGVNFWPGSTRIVLADTPATIATNPVWMELTWDVGTDGAVTLSSDKLVNSVADNIGGAASRILIHGGRGANLAGVYIDDVTITVVPEPATFALLLGGLGLLTVLIRRRMR